MKLNTPLKPGSLGQRVRAQEFCPEIYIYPTPRMYGPLVGFSLESLELTPEINIYVHVPFCKQFCTFCGYFKTIHEENLQEQFVQAVIGEIALRAASIQGKVVKTLHFGGGTPSLLTPVQLTRIVDALRRVNPALLETCLEVSIEATPESVEREKFEGYRQAGINRVSMGVQSLVDEEVVLANRCVVSERSSYQLLTEATECLREVGVPDVVVDLMIGIEGQTVTTFEHTVRQALTLRPETVQLYALGVMPQTGLGRRKPPRLMPGPEIYQCYEIGRRLFTEAGYRRDSHDRYTLHPLNGFLQGDYNIRGMSLVGLGAGARSYARGVHFRNTYTTLNGRKALQTYISNITSGRHSVESGVYLDADEQMRQYCIGHLAALDQVELRRLFGQSFEEKFPDLYEDMVRAELVGIEGSVLRLTEQGLLFRDLIGRQLFSPRARELEDAYRSGTTGPAR